MRVICFLVSGLIVCSYPPNIKFLAKSCPMYYVTRGHVQDSPDAYQLDPNIANGSRFGVRTLTILPLLGFKLNWAPILAILSCFYGFL